MKRRVLTGIKPTGIPHIGNYVGAIAPLLAFASDPDYTANVCIADFHALTTAAERPGIPARTLSIAATLLALGLDPENCLFYRQSDVPETFELAVLLANFTAKGLMNRGHAYKAAVRANREAGATEDEIDRGINMGLFNYPILMTADIVLFDTDVVPVGRDQRQHVEFARDIAGAFNAACGPVLKLPELALTGGGEELPGLDGRKMSKSYHNTIPLFAPAEELKRACMRIRTDSRRPDEPKDADSSIIWKLYRAIAPADRAATFGGRFLAGGLGYGQAKGELFELLEESFGPARAAYDRLMAEPGDVEELLRQGAARARGIAGAVLERVRTAVGFNRGHT